LSDFYRFYGGTLGWSVRRQLKKKPFNPVIEEVHLCWVRHTDDDDISEFVAEQVSHHPPVSAFVVRNKKQNITIQGDVTFSVGFGSNYASVNTAGHVTIKTSKEHYCMSKVMPNMMVNNVIWGVKYLMWTGTIEIDCPETGYHAHLELKEVGQRNVVSGIITQRTPRHHTAAATTPPVDSSSTTTTTSTSTPSSETSTDPNTPPKKLFVISGLAGDKVYISDYKPETTTSEEGSETDEYKSEEKSQEDKPKTLLLDLAQYADSTISYIPEEAQTGMNALRLWKSVKKAIVDNNMFLADEEKKKIEADQRKRESVRRANNLTKQGTYFSFIPNEHHNDSNNLDPDDLDGDVVDLDQKGHWEFKDNITINRNFIQNIQDEVAKKRAEAPPAQAESTATSTTNGTATSTTTNGSYISNESCIVS